MRENIKDNIRHGRSIGIGYAIRGTILYWAMNKELKGKD